MLRGRACPRGVEANVANCDIIVCEFELQSRYYVHFQIKSLGMNFYNTTTIEWIVQPPFFYTDRLRYLY